MITRRQIQTIRSLDRKKVRDERGLFLAEGPKLVDELSAVFELVFVAHTSDYAWSGAPRCEEVEVSEAELARLSLLTTPHSVVAVFRKPADSVLTSLSVNSGSLIVALDGVQDPGNVGTILRLADWFGVDTVVCSRDCADVFSPKVVQACMGALAHVAVRRVDMVGFLRALPTGFPVWGAYLSGDDLYTTKVERRGVILLGSEGNGISPACGQYVTRRLYIPSFAAGRATCESLNVSTAAAIVISEFCVRGQ